MKRLSYYTMISSLNYYHGKGENMAKIHNMNINDLNNHNNYNDEQKKVFDELCIIHKEWQEALNDLKKQQEKYNNLITQVHKIKQIIIKDGLKTKISIWAKFRILLFKLKNT